MRLTGAILIWIVFVGGLALYMYQRATASVDTVATLEIPEARGDYTLAVTTTFTVEPDPFALQTGDTEKPPALQILMAGKEILRMTDRLPAGIPIRVSPLNSLVTGVNELYLEASLPLEMTGEEHAVRVQVLLADQTVTDQTFWSSPSGKVSQTIRFTLAAPEKEHAHEPH